MAFSLKGLCLDLIVQEFERFHFASRISNDETIQRQFEVLRTECSIELVSSLYEKEKMKDEFLDFFINENVKSLNHDLLKSFRCPTKDIFCRLSNLTEGFFGGCCTDEILENITKFCPKIVLIDATSSPVTDNGIKCLCKDEKGEAPCPELKILGLRGTKLRSKDIKYVLKYLPSLEILDWPAVPTNLYFLYGKKLSNLEKGYSHSLTELNFSSLYYKTYYTKLLKICLTVCPNLKSIACCIRKKKQFDFFNTTSLEKLQIRFLKSCKNINLNNFLKMSGSNLVYLNICNCTISIFDLAVSCPKLEELHTKKITFLDDDDSQPHFRCLTKCVFNNIKEESVEIKAIRFLLLFSPKLEAVSFRYCSLSASSKTHILLWCARHPIKIITFEGIAEINFVKDILLGCCSLLNLYLIGYKLSSDDKKELNSLVQTLPNKPRILRYRLESEKFLPGTVAGTLARGAL